VPPPAQREIESLSTNASKEELDEFAVRLKQSELFVIRCDAEIQHKWPFRGKPLAVTVLGDPEDALE
jgi:hypothetical protein